MTIRSSEHFIYANVQSVNFGIINVNIGGGGMQEEPFVANRELKEVRIRGNDKPYFQNIQRQPLQFNVSFAFEDRWDEQKIREVARWLTNHEYYQPLIFSDSPEKIYYAIVIDDSTLIHNSLSQGYINLTFRCDSPYVYSPQSISNLYDWNEVPYTFDDADMSQGTSSNLVLDINGDLILDPVKTKWVNLLTTLTWNEV
jgi:predicted phage tail component-like protein